MATPRTLVWTGNAGDGNFANPANWQDTVTGMAALTPPTSIDTVEFTAATGSTIGGTGTADTLVVFGGGNWTFDGSVLVYGQATIGPAAGTSGTVIVTMGGSLIPDNLVVGQFGDGTILVDDQGTLGSYSLDAAADPGSSGVITVSGSDSALNVESQLTIGDHGTATLSITDGATVLGQSNMDIGLHAGSVGNVNVLSSSWLYVLSNLTVGDAGQGTLTIAGYVNADSVLVGASGIVAGLGGAIYSSIDFNNTGTMSGSMLIYSYDIYNTGTIVAQSGLLELNGYISGSGGVMQIGDGGTLQIDQFVYPGQTVEFMTANGTLNIEAPAGFTSVIEGYVPGDTVNVFDVSITPEIYSYSGDNTIVHLSNTAVVLTFAGHFESGSIDLQLHETPGPDAPFPPHTWPCFLVGTRIATKNGEIAVEDLRVGDLVVTASGRLRPIRWIGTCNVDPSSHPKPAAVLPVCVRRHAFGPGAPHRDLFLSPDHAVFVEDVLIPVKYLINGGSIRQLAEYGTITYFHVELDRHDVLLAQGLTAESYLETGSRAMFENDGASTAPYPDFGERVWEAEGCAPLVVVGPKLEAARRRLASREALTGCRPPIAA